MIQRVKEEYYEMCMGLMSGLVVDKQLSDKIQEVLTEASGKIQHLVDSNKEHVFMTSSGLVYPRGNQTFFQYIGRDFLLTPDQCIEIFRKALAMRRVNYIFRTDESWKEYSRLKAFVQRAIEDDLDAKEKETDSNENNV